MVSAAPEEFAALEAGGFGEIDASADRAADADRERHGRVADDVPRRLLDAPAFPEQEREQVAADAAPIRVRRGGNWTADYVRLRFIVRKPRLMRYLPLTDTDRATMLRVIGAPSRRAVRRRARAARLDGPIAGPVDPRVARWLVERHMGALSRKNMVAGDVPVLPRLRGLQAPFPATVDHIIQRGEFLTSYTPYQPEIAQGTLQVLFEFQTQVARLFGCEVANASMYDGSTAMWEAIFMARRITRRDKTIVSSGCTRIMSTC